MTTIQALRQALGGIAAIALTSAVVHAQDVDPRWRAWTGCWTPIAGANMPGQVAGTVCVLPATGKSAVDILSVSGSKVTDRMHLDADGAEHPVSRDGCTGVEAARWSPNGTRVYLREALQCGAISRNSTGVMSFDQQYRWLDVRGVSSGTTQGVAVARYEALMDSTGLPAEVRPAFALRGPAANNAILAASAPLTLADIADVATSADTGVATTWLVERTRDVSLSINGKQLEALADQGVAPPVIDVLVAIAYPTNFALNTGSTAPVERPAVAHTDRSAYRDYLYSDPYSWYPYDPWSLYSYGFGYYGYRYGYGYYSPYSYYNPYGYYPGSGPIIVVNGSGGGGGGGTVGSSHGRVTRSGGYTQGGSGSSGGGTAGRTTSVSGGSASSSGSSSSGSASSSSGGGRVAVRKPPE